MERELDYALSGYNVHDALALAEHILAQRKGEASEYAPPESLKVFSKGEYEALQKVIDRDTARKQKIKTFKVLRKTDVQVKANTVNAAVTEKSVDDDDMLKDSENDEDVVPVKEGLEALYKKLLFQVSLYDEAIKEIDDSEKTWNLATEYEDLSVFSKTIFTKQNSFYGMKLVGTFNCSL